LIKIKEIEDSIGLADFQEETASLEKAKKPSKKAFQSVTNQKPLLPIKGNPDNLYQSLNRELPPVPSIRVSKHLSLVWEVGF